jgi:hypothetical protein
MHRLLLVLGVLLAGCTSIQTQVVIDAPAKNVRSVLFDFNDYPAWNPFIVKVDGAVSEGRDVTVTVKPVGKDPISGTTTVLALTDNRLAWRGSLAIPGLFTGHHEFLIEEVDATHTRFRNNESMSGAVIPFYNFKPTEAGFEQMNQALKRKAEDAAKSGSQN